MEVVGAKYWCCEGRFGNLDNVRKIYEICGVKAGTGAVKTD